MNELAIDFTGSTLSKNTNDSPRRKVVWRNKTDLQNLESNGMKIEKDISKISAVEA